MSRPPPDQALEQYFSELKQRGVAHKQLTLARHFLRHLLSTLRDLPQDGLGYRKAAELTLRNFPEDAHFVELIRDFFPHWNGEAPDTTTLRAAIPTGNTAEQSALQNALVRMNADPWAHTTLIQLERQAHQLKSMHRYAEELKKAGLDDANIQARLKLIKLLLFTIRDVTQNTDSYRTGVDQVLSLCPHQERWHVFVSLAREFFYFLAHDPDAAGKLQKQIGTAELQGMMST
ncbi:hypothetical protein FNU76_20770 [Chitinimonas arctica]|uniref:Uncharacterized protein n=1 Tax=Chitinimonas arctica TaxID=2594795 RepID=A0A516SKA0_9NEIS|nr:hypothetical protein [Chitinimonas arctica]QDQ28587.1 hypothetical protein FNU76_20770 [Chitinimonas arctica]